MTGDYDDPLSWVLLFLKALYMVLEIVLELFE